MIPHWSFNAWPCAQSIMWVGTVFGNGQDILGKSVNPCVWVRGDGILNIANECFAAKIESMRLLSPDTK